ncbi:MAG: TadE/TadG family type IV pilus assembly protein, partial [Telluria sp.]
MFRADTARGQVSRPSPRQGGLAAVEFGLVIFIFFSFLFGVLEVTRAMYV